MFINKKNKPVKRKILGKVGLALAGLAIIVFISVPLARNLQKQYAINKEVSDLQLEINSLKGKNNELANLISYFETDQFVEEQARLNLNYKKENEELVIINKKDAPAGGSDVLNENNNVFYQESGNLLAVGKLGSIKNLTRWWQYFILRGKFQNTVNDL